MPLMNISVQGLTEVSTTQKLQLGALYIESTDGATATIKGNGERVWRYVKNDEASTAFAAGNLVQRKDSTTTMLGVLPSTTPRGPNAYLGVAQHAIAAGSYGWVLTKGWGTVLADTGGISANQALIAGNAVSGAFDSSSTATTAGLGWATTAITAAATGSAYIDIPC